MKTVIGVKFRKPGKVYFFDPENMQIKKEDYVIVETSMGEEIGKVVIDNKKVNEEKLANPLKKVIRLASKKDLEYGSAEIEMRTGQIKPGQRILIHDDLLATGGTTEAAARLVQKQGATVSQFSFLIGLKDLHGEDRLKQFDADVYTILDY